MSYLSLGLALGFVGLAAIVSRYQELGLEKDLAIGVIRAFIQLTIVGYILSYVFASHNQIFIVLMISLMIGVAAHNAAKRGKGVPQAQSIVLIGIAFSEGITLLLLLALRIIPATAQYIIPLSGMIVGNSMIAAGVTMNRLTSEFKLRRGEVELALSLGAPPKKAALPVIQSAVKAGMIPTVDSMKTVGLVQLPGMMTGQILAGADPIQAVRYQIMVMFMISGASALTSLIVVLLGYTRYFTPHAQLVVHDS
ncbi:ABC transporter permease [Desulfitobacterium sp.]|uniref:ABC transporter permease n=1 Tax=Desulfitobacterium sp. TaxID=49981 RepID=UPI002CFA9069|nr:iron export ABC transporter permease subunit FetB [Desulfitobacterium sp.]HVJ48552.1 iron export ABC transporter permease subunit FetB [Desulfitobacterium sp.]